MTDKDKMIEEMWEVVIVVQGCKPNREDCCASRCASYGRCVRIIKDFFNAGIRPKEGFELDMSETKQELFEEDISIKPKQYKEE